MQVPQQNMVLLHKGKEGEESSWSLLCLLFSSVQFSRSVMSDSLQPHGLQHARPPCPSPTLRVHPNPCPLSPWWHPTISSSVVPFSSCLQSFPASGSFQMSQFFTSGGQRIWVSVPLIRLLNFLLQFFTTRGNNSLIAWWDSWRKIYTREYRVLFLCTPSPTSQLQFFSTAQPDPHNSTIILT